MALLVLLEGFFTCGLLWSKSNWQVLSSVWTASGPPLQQLTLEKPLFVSSFGCCAAYPLGCLVLIQCSWIPCSFCNGQMWWGLFCRFQNAHL